jgi:hypothetical protein
MPIAEDDRKKIVEAVRAYIARERISREEFAQRAKLGKSTVDKLVVGIFSEKTILQIESQLKTSFRKGESGGERSGEEYGKYSREETSNYIGEYVFARPSFQGKGAILAFPMEISWDGEGPSLLVKESAKSNRDALQLGRVYIPRASMHIFILSNERGWLKSVILSQLDVSKRMKGMMLTMGRAFANVYAPMAMPVIMNKYEKITDDMVGTIESGTRMHAEYEHDLQAVEQDRFARWISLAAA